MAKTIDFTAKNVKPFTDWLKKFLVIEKSLLLEIDIPNKCFIAKTYNEEKSVVKYSKLFFDDAGLSLIKNYPNITLIKAGIYSIQRFIKSLEHFNSYEFDFSIQYDELVDSDNFTATAIQLKGNLLKIKIECTTLSIFQYISDDMFKNTIANTDIIAKFELQEVTIDKINSLCDLDKEYKFLEFVVRNKQIILRGKTFELNLAENGNENFVLSIYKEQFNKIDSDNYNVELGNEKLIYRSKNNETITVTSMVVKDEKYEEGTIDF